MNLKNKVNIHNRFDIEVRDAQTGLLKKSFTSYNIVLSQMYTRLCGGLSYFVNIHFGSSTGTLSAARTSLFSHLGTKAAVDEEIIKSIPLSIWKRKIVLNPEEYVGSTISEVGIAYGSTNTNLVTHSLLKDSEGNPISIVKTDVDIITIYATVFVTFDNSNPNLVYIGMPSSNALVNYLIGGGSAPTGAFSLFNQLNTVTALGSTASVTWTADVTNKQRKTNTPRFGTTVANGHAKVLRYNGVFDLVLPSVGVFSGQEYLGVSLGSGDGVLDEFILPSQNIRDSSVVMKVNGVVTNNYVRSYLFGGYYSRRNNVSSFSNVVASLISYDGNLLIVSTTNTGSYPYRFYVFDKVGDDWVLRSGDQVPSMTSFASDMAMNLNGNRLAVGNNESPNIHTFNYVGGVFTKLPSPTNLSSMGAVNGVALSNDGNVLAIGYGSYAPYFAILDFVTDRYVKRANPSVVPNGTVYGVGISGDGKVVAISYANSPYIIVYDDVDGVLVARSTFSSTLAGLANGLVLSNDGNLMAFISNVTPSFFVYRWNGSSWVQETVDVAPTGQCREITMTRDGSFIVVYSGSAPYVQTYEEVNGVWKKYSNIIDVTGMADLGCVSQDRKFMFVPTSAGSYCYEGNTITKIKFNTPPAIGDIITADYTVDGIHKTDQYVIDVSFAIQFGEGS